MLPGPIFLNQRGLYVTWAHISPTGLPFLIALGLGIALAALAWRVLRRRRELYGRPTYFGEVSLAVGGILLSFPIGILLALGRRSSLPVVKIFSTAFIETVRGVPLVTILFMSSIILALFLPQDFRIDRLIRALLGMTLFSAAYMAENVRVGLQDSSRCSYSSRLSFGSLVL